MLKKPTTGGYVAAYCTRCRLDLGHTIVAMVGEIIVRVKCRTCGSEHNYRGKPGKKTGAKRSASPARRTETNKSAEKRWESEMSKAKGADILYDGGRPYSAGDIVVHTVFGRGVVLKTSEKKVTLLFKDKERVLVSAN